jgi:hypothetical protein
MSSPIPLNYQIAEAQVAQSIESTSPSLYFGDGSSAPYRVIARSSPGSTTIKFKKVGK